ncbi:MAG TPA: ABC transporter substrate-binding protein [Thermoplasmata archaeon]|nr:ABC transporter substrate-binding protein [Thermoplasmata archaeon]
MHLPDPSTDTERARRTVPLAMFAVVIIIVAGASIGGVAAYYSLRPGSPSGPVAVTDDLGRHVKVPYDPARVAVLGPSILDSMYRLGLRGHVVAVDCYASALGGLSSDYSSDQVALWNLSSSMCVEVGPTFDVEQLLAFSPQLVLAATIVSVAAVEQITQTYDIPVVMLQPATLGGIIVDEQILGEIFGVSSAASSLVTGLQSGLYQASSLTLNLTDNGTPFPTVLVTYSADANGYWTFGPGTFGESLIELASATSISANATLPYPELSGEQVLASNPEFIVFGTGFGLNESTYSGGPFWSQLGATQNGHALGLDSNYFTEPDPTMILVGLPELIAILHPGVSA